MKYAILNESRTITNIIEVEPEYAADFDAHYLGDAPIGIGDTYPETDYPLPEPEHEPTETQTLGQQITDEQLERIEMGQAYTDLELALLEQGQKITDVELEALKNV